MPNKDLIKIFFFALISGCSWFLSEASLAEIGETPSDFEVLPACRGWEVEDDFFSIEHLCVVTVRPGDERPRYVQNLGSETFRFLFSQFSLALVVDDSMMAELRASSSIRKMLLAELTVDRMSVWHQDAIYWWRWLQKSDKSWSGGKARGR